MKFHIGCYSFNDSEKLLDKKILIYLQDNASWMTCTKKIYNNVIN